MVNDDEYRVFNLDKLYQEHVGKGWTLVQYIPGRLILRRNQPEPAAQTRRSKQIVQSIKKRR